MPSALSKLLQPIPILIVLVLGAVGFVFFTPQTSVEEFYEEKDVLYEEVTKLFLSGKWQEGQALLDKTDKGFKKWQHERLQPLVDRVQKAIAKADEAKRLMVLGERVRAAQVMSEAAALYPESKELRSAADYYQGQVALSQKDYVLYLRLAEQNIVREPQSADAILWLTNALTLQYGATGDESYKQRALEALTKGEGLGHPGMQKAFKAEADLVRERLKSRASAAATTTP
jgi:hypothetical protein